MSCRRSRVAPQLIDRQVYARVPDAAADLDEDSKRPWRFLALSSAGFELSYTPSGRFPAEALGEDFTDLLLTLGQVALDKGRGVAFLLDEVQCVPASEFGPFVVGLHRLNQKALPVTCVAAGLPSLPALVGEAKRYAERLFEYPRIDRLPKADALSALTDPASRRDVVWERAALDDVFEQTGGCPYFLQQYGKYIWDVASETTITVDDARAGGREAQQRLDDGFFLRIDATNGARQPSRSPRR